jgi:hypothetical protein
MHRRQFLGGALNADAGQVNVVSWEPGADGVTVWLRDRPTLSAKGSSLHDAADVLYELLLQQGDGEAALEFDPPRHHAGEF